MESEVIYACQSAVKNQLKDPDSVHFSSWEAWEVTTGTPMGALTYSPELGDKFYNSVGVVNAANSLGGYVGDKPYVCDGVISHDGTTYVRARPVSILGSDS